MIYRMLTDLIMIEALTRFRETYCNSCTGQEICGPEKGDCEYGIEPLKRIIDEVLVEIWGEKFVEQMRQEQEARNNAPFN